MHGGHYEIEIDQWTYVVPDRAILPAAPNPSGRAVVCYSCDTGPLDGKEDHSELFVLSRQQALS